MQGYNLIHLVATYCPALDFSVKAAHQYKIRNNHGPGNLVNTGCMVTYQTTYLNCDDYVIGSSYIPNILFIVYLRH